MNSELPPFALAHTIAGVLSRRLADQDLRFIRLDTTNPSGGRGGSLDSDQCAWLVRELGNVREHDVVIVTRHRSSELSNATRRPGEHPRVLGLELTTILLGRPQVVGWIAGHRHAPSAIRHGAGPRALWEVTPSALGAGWRGVASRLARQAA